MHTYSTDNDNRTVVYGFLGVISWVFVVSIGHITSLLTSGFPAITGGTISWGIIFKLLCEVFNRYLWKMGGIRAIGISKVQDFSGDWEGHIKTSYDGQSSETAQGRENSSETDMQRMPSSLSIDQTWRKINIHFSVEESKSDSTGATILTKKGQYQTLTYQYRNETKADTESSMSSHSGTAKLSLKQSEEQDVLEGFYYTDHNRGNYGEMQFKRQE